MSMHISTVKSCSLRNRAFCWSLFVIHKHVRNSTFLNAVIYCAVMYTCRNIRWANGPFGVLDPEQRVVISARFLISVSDTAYSICTGAQITRYRKLLDFINEGRSLKRDHRNIIFPSIYKTKWSVAETSIPRDHSDPLRDFPGAPRDPLGPPGTSHCAQGPPGASQGPRRHHCPGNEIKPWFFTNFQSAYDAPRSIREGSLGPPWGPGGSLGSPRSAQGPSRDLQRRPSDSLGGPRTTRDPPGTTQRSQWQPQGCPGTPGFTQGFQGTPRYLPGTAMDLQMMQSPYL